MEEGFHSILCCLAPHLILLVGNILLFKLPSQTQSAAHALFFNSRLKMQFNVMLTPNC